MTISLNNKNYYDVFIVIIVFLDNENITLHTKSLEKGSILSYSDLHQIIAPVGGHFAFAKLDTFGSKKMMSAG